eukprot:3895290-Pleurochrysis_carterae.AAC.1
MTGRASTKYRDRRRPASRLFHRGASRGREPSRTGLAWTDPTATTVRRSSNSQIRVYAQLR